MPVLYQNTVHLNTVYLENTCIQVLKQPRIVFTFIAAVSQVGVTHHRINAMHPFTSLFHQHLPPQIKVLLLHYMTLGYFKKRLFCSTAIENNSHIPVDSHLRYMSSQSEPLQGWNLFWCHRGFLHIPHVLSICQL